MTMNDKYSKEMKNIYWIICAGFLIMASCTKADLTDSDLKEINEVTIAGIEPEYTVVAGQTLTIEPDLNATLDSDADSGYEYEWVYNLDDDRGGLAVLATTRNLDIAIQLPPKDYTMSYRVTDLATGVTWSQRFNLQVRTAI